MTNDGVGIHDPLPNSAGLSRRRILAVSIGLVALFLAGWEAYRIHVAKQRVEEWKQHVEARGALVYLSGYSTAPLPLARIPVIREFFIRSHLVMFIPNSTVGKSVLQLLHERPELGRIWVHRDNVSPEVLEQLKAVCPDVEINRYT
jgi:hypothetical protein